MRINLDPRFVERHSKLIAGMCEKQKRLYLGILAMELPYGGISAIAAAFGCSRGCVQRGKAEAMAGVTYVYGERIRAVGGGRKKIEITHKQAILQRTDIDDTGKEKLWDLTALVNETLRLGCYGDPMETRKWINVTVKSIATDIFKKTGQKYSHSSIKRIVRSLGYSLQKNQKYFQAGKKHPKRGVQYDHIQEKISEYRSSGDPIISIDTKAKEKLGDFLRFGRIYRLHHDPLRTLDHDFAFLFQKFYNENDALFPSVLLQQKAIVIPYGVYCVNNNKGYVTLGIDSDTSEFAADSILNWWNAQGKHDFPNSKRILILSDGGGSNRSAGWLFKAAIQQIADTTGMVIDVCHFAPGKSKCNPIEHLMWCHVTRAWNCHLLKNLETVKELTTHTTTETGLIVHCEINYGVYLTESEKKKARENGESFSGIDNTLETQAQIQLERYGTDSALMNWNYTIRPHSECEKWENFKTVAKAS